MTLTLPGRPPSKKNSKRIVRFGSRAGLISSQQYMAWREEMGLRIRRDRPKVPIAKASISMTFYAESRRRFDLSNSAESVNDLLVEEGFLEDDSADHLPELRLHFGGVDKSSPRVEISISPIA